MEENHRQKLALVYRKRKNMEDIRLEDKEIYSWHI